MFSKILCPICEYSARKLIKVSGYQYYQCSNCRSIFIDTEILHKINEGISLVEYDSHYWDNEIKSAKERSYGSSLARVAEVFYYSRIPIRKFLDIGTGPGYLLDALEKLLPSKNIFYGVEKFPPPSQYRTKSPKYVIGDLSKIEFTVDAGVCIEVIEHLTPRMLMRILKDLSKVSNAQALYIFNTGMPEYVIDEDMNYLDPTRRGHIVSYSLRAISILANKYGFTTWPIPGKRWAFVLEYSSNSPKKSEKITERIWTALDKNLNSLSDPEMGSTLKILGLETARAYH